MAIGQPTNGFAFNAFVLANSNHVVTSATVKPSNTLLTGHLTFVRPAFLETNAYAGALGVAAVLRDTEFPLVTRPAPMPPRLTVISPDSAPFQLRYAGESNRIYHLQGTEDFVTWTDLLVTNRATAVYTDLRSSLKPASASPPSCSSMPRASAANCSAAPSPSCSSATPTLCSATARSP